jgi:hypothetical protein
MAVAPLRHAIRERPQNRGKCMARSRIGIAPWLIVPGLALGATAGLAVSPAMAATDPSTIDTDLAGPPADPSMVFTGTASQPLAGSLPGSSAPIPVTFIVTNPDMLPPGVAVGSTGTVTGIPAADGIYAAGVKACDVLGCTSGTLTFSVSPDPASGAIGSATVALSLQTIRVGT